MPCITRSFDPAIGPLINLGIAKPATIKTSPTDQGAFIHPCIALVDTGADVTCISKQIAKDVGLTLLGKTSRGSASGIDKANVYLADVALPFGDPTDDTKIQTFIGENMEIMEFEPNSPHYQALLGRDIISRCLFSMTSYDKRFTICM